MATGNRRRSWGLWKRRKKANQVKKATEAQQDEEPAVETVIKKGIYLSALIYVEGEQAAPADFDSVALEAAKKKLATAFEGDGDLHMSVKKIEIKNDVEEDDEEGNEKDKKGEEKFQF